MKSINTNSIVEPNCKFVEIVKHNDMKSLFDPDTENINAGVLIWHCLENRLFLSESFCRMIGLPENRISNSHEIINKRVSADLEVFIGKLDACLYDSQNKDLVFDVGIPGTNKILHGYVETIDMEWFGILDIIIICIVEERGKE